jgi:hypothetical protein
MVAMYGLGKGQNIFGLVAQSLDFTGIWAIGGSSGLLAHGTTMGVIAKAFGQNGVGVLGTTGQSATIGVRGETETANGVGVHGKASKSAVSGVRGESQNGTGVAASGRHGCTAYGTTGYALYGQVPSGGTGYAAVLQGRVSVAGSFTVTGGPKSAAVPHPDGSFRRLYCQESPEPWFEDFGEGHLVDGQATITLDKDFAAVVLTNAYHAFVTEYGASTGLYVADRRPDSFTVRAVDAKSTSAFSYRIVARRKDVPGPRLEKVAIPAALPDLPPPSIPTMPELMLPTST